MPDSDHHHRQHQHNIIIVDIETNTTLAVAHQAILAITTGIAISSINGYLAFGTVDCLLIVCSVSNTETTLMEFHFSFF